MMKGNKVVELGEHFYNLTLLTDSRKDYRPFQSILRRDLHIILCTFIDERMHVVIHPRMLFKIRLHKVRIHIIFRMIYGV